MNSGSGTYFYWKFLIATGYVAEKSEIYLSSGIISIILATITLKSSERSLSTSSRTSILQFSSLAIFLEARSRILPGVATIMWTV